MGKWESGIQDRIVTHLNHVGGDHIMVRVKHGTAFAVVGDPDIYGCYHGYYFAFEVKNEQGHLTKIQQHRIREIRAAGGIAFGVRTPDEAWTFLLREMRAR